MSKAQLILSIIQAALTGLATVTPIAGEISAFTLILQHALTLYQTETGQPLDLTKIPLETPVT